MRIYIMEDDISVINILKDIIEDEELGEICGDCGGDSVPVREVLDCRPDVILVDFLMPTRDGVEFVRELRETDRKVKCIMISQVSAKDLIAKAYSAGIDFFINKPINIIEVSSVLRQVEKQLMNERTLDNIRQMFRAEMSMPPAEPKKDPGEIFDQEVRRILNRLGMAGEKGCPDVIRMCGYLYREKLSVNQLSVTQLCGVVDPNPKSTEQRVRRAIDVGMTHLANLGIEDFMNETYTRYAGTLFSFEDMRQEMDFIRGKRRSGGKVNIKKFLDGLMLEAEQNSK